MIRGMIYGLSAAAIWGGLYVVSDIVLETIPPFTLLTIRLLMGTAIVGLIIRLNPSLSLPALPGIRRLITVGIVGFGVSVGMQFVGTDKSTAINGALVTSASPAFILLFASLLLKEKLTSRHILSVLLATIGVVVIVDPLNANFSSETFIGDLALTIAAVTWGLYSVLVRRVSGNFDTMIITLFAFIGGLMLAIPAMVVELQTATIGAITWGIVLGVLYLGVISTAVAMWMWNRAFALVDASIAALFFFAQPLVGALLSTFVLGQQLTPGLVVGGGLIIVGVAISVTAQRRQQKPPRPAA